MNPATAPSSVVLPHPDGPTITWSSPGRDLQVQSSTAMTGAPDAAYDLAHLAQAEPSAGHVAVLPAGRP